jgi:hypothetical protein
MDKMLNKSLIGVSLYSIITNRDIELMFTSSDYPFSKLNISVSGSNEDLSKYQIEDSLVIDADTLYLLYRIDIFDILEEFDNIYIPYQTFEKMRNNYGLYQNKYTKELIDLLEKDVRFKSIPVTVANEQYEKYIKLYDENISQCLLISDSEEIPFLSSEISLKRYFANKKVIDINNLICHLRSLKCDDEKISDWIYKLRKNNFEFISFKSIDIYNSYFRYDEVGLELYLKMTKISNYLSFVEVYIWFLVIIGQEVEVYNFKELSGKFINYIDKYTGKTRYYISEIRRVNSIEAHEYSYQIENKIAQIFNDFNVKRIYELIIILNESERFNRNILTKKIKEIISAYIHFLNRFVKMSLILDYTESKLLNLIYKNTELNNNKIIDYFIDI